MVDMVIAHFPGLPFFTTIYSFTLMQEANELLFFLSCLLHSNKRRKKCHEIFFQKPASKTISSRYLLYSWKFSRDLYFKNFVVQTKFVKMKYFQSITPILSIEKKKKNGKIASLNLLIMQSKFVKYRALENNQLYNFEDISTEMAEVRITTKLFCL